MHIYARAVPCIWDCTWLNQARVLHAVIHRRKLWHAHMTHRIRAAALFTEGRIIDYSVAMLLVSPRLVSVTSPCTAVKSCVQHVFTNRPGGTSVQVDYGHRPLRCTSQHMAGPAAAAAPLPTPPHPTQEHPWSFTPYQPPAPCQQPGWGPIPATAQLLSYAVCSRTASPSAQCCWCALQGCPHTRMPPSVPPCTTGTATPAAPSPVAGRSPAQALPPVQHRNSRACCRPAPACRRRPRRRRAGCPPPAGFHRPWSFGAPPGCAPASPTAPSRVHTCGVCVYTGGGGGGGWEWW